MNCSQILKNGNNCKHSATNKINDIYYCTRHYNIIIKTKHEDQDTQENKTQAAYNTAIEIPNIGIDIKTSEFINNGTFLSVYKILLNDKYYALKIQNLENNQKNVIYYEYILLSQHLNDSNFIIKLYDGGMSYYYKNNIYGILITELMYETLYDKKNRYNFNIQEIKEIGIQLINSIKYIHNKKYLYIDLKPDNIMFINEKDNIIKLIDFNCCSKYINHMSEFYENKLLKNPTGNFIYSSININKSYSGVRIDDIESILWVILYLLECDIINNITNAKTKLSLIKLKEKFIKDNNYDCNFIKEFINELKKYSHPTNINNKRPDYQKFIDILT